MVPTQLDVEAHAKSRGETDEATVRMRAQSVGLQVGLQAEINAKRGMRVMGAGTASRPPALALLGRRGGPG